MNTWFGRYAAVAISGATGFFLYQTICWSCLDASAWASWVGAIGTVGALGAAIWIATQDRRQRDRVAYDLAVITASKILLSTYTMKALLQGIAKSLEANQQDGRLFPFTHQALFLEKIDEFDMEDLTRLAVLPNHIGAKLAASNVAIMNIKMALEDASTYAVNGMLDPGFFEMVLTHVKFAQGWVDDAHQQCRKVTDVLNFPLT